MLMGRNYLCLCIIVGGVGGMGKMLKFATKYSLILFLFCLLASLQVTFHVDGMKLFMFLHYNQ